MAQKIRIAVKERLAEGASGIDILEEVISALKEGLTEGEEIQENESKGSDSNRINEVTELMHKLGIPAHISGYRYLRDAILYLIGSNTIISSVTKDLYPRIAHMYDTTPSKVERGMRHAIGVAWDRGDVDLLNKLFGYTISSDKGKPTNSEFIAMITDHLRLKHKLS